MAEVATRFGLYAQELRSGYAMLYLHNILPLLTSIGGRSRWEPKPTPANMIGEMLSFVETCLAHGEAAP